ncbi:PREDICTED: putative nuclease HARBI1 [Diuraphis noxia]|uniref:putative nuclease HARBI1 n=1 Tax=Diuraphis noxia TaxID=143948 RepID=UPI0007638D11|nr:PREDICTED: putative nuclease HARBI1 [Diuraphis noxia]
MKKMKKRNREYWVHPIYSSRLLHGKFHTLHSKLLNFPEKSTIRDITKSTCEQIWNILQPLFMAIKQEEDWIKIADEFYTRTNFPNIIGAIDGKHIRMIQPEHSGTSYFNYKKFFSCVLMAWTDADYKFVYIDVGSYGTASDSEIFKTSEMGKRLSENQLNIPSGRHLPNDDDGNVIPFSVVGDEAFGLGNHILRPYAKRNLNYTKRIFNYRHTRARRVVECTFGILANKWRIFHRPIDVNIDFCVRIIKACCVLHNYVRIKDGVKFTDTLYNCPMDNLTIINENNRGRNNMDSVRQYMSSYFISPEGAISCQYDKV